MKVYIYKTNRKVPVSEHLLDLREHKWNKWEKLFKIGLWNLKLKVSRQVPTK